jgi:flagellar protein FlaF
MLPCQADWDLVQGEVNSALLFNRKLWSILVSTALRDRNPLPIAQRQNIVNIGIFALTRTMDIQLNPAPEKLK